MKFEFYVLNCDLNKNRVVKFNIFQNWVFQEDVEKEIKKYLRSPKKYTYELYTPREENKKYFCGFEGLCMSIDALLSYYFRSKREYEISVADAFEEDINNLTKIDVYYQCKNNVEIIARECIYQYKKQRKE